jgi:hypothetical protein
VLGQRSPTGFRYYYLVVLAVKTPVAMLLLALWMPWLLWRTKYRLHALMPVAFSLAIILVATLSRINIGVRHILPVYVGLSVGCGVALASIFRQWRQRIVATLAAAALLAWCVISGVLQHPDYIAYTNEFEGIRGSRLGRNPA